MSYFDDLGLPQNASPEQIREAYRTLARLLHPDQQTDPVLKRAADAQMRRINAIYAVLSDPESRRRYIAELNAPQVREPHTRETHTHERPAPMVQRPPQPVAARVRIRRGSLVWIAVAVVSLGGIFWLSIQGQPRGVQPEWMQKIEAGNSPVEAIEARMPAPQRPAEIPKERSAGDTPVAVPSDEPPVQPLRSFGRGLAGSWAYLHDRDTRQIGAFPPLFIEASITENEGQLHGKYQARYFVSDRPISPNVNFEFEGENSGRSAKFPWRGDGGSTGIVQVRLITDSEMEVVWWATDLGQSLGLASGTAVLRRRPD